jgi:hypothetical protein
MYELAQVRGRLAQLLYARGDGLYELPEDLCEVAQVLFKDSSSKSYQDASRSERPPLPRSPPTGVAVFVETKRGQGAEEEPYSCTVTTPDLARSSSVSGVPFGALRAAISEGPLRRVALARPASRRCRRGMRLRSDRRRGGTLPGRQRAPSPHPSRPIARRRERPSRRPRVIAAASLLRRHATRQHSSALALALFELTHDLRVRDARRAASSRLDPGSLLVRKRRAFRRLAGRDKCGGFCRPHAGVTHTGRVARRSTRPVP